MRKTRKVRNREIVADLVYREIQLTCPVLIKPRRNEIKTRKENVSNLLMRHKGGKVFCRRCLRLTGLFRSIIANE